MPREYHAVPLAPDKVDQAFPLAQLLASDLSLDEWQGFCRSAIQGPGTETGNRSPGNVGIIIVLSDRDYIHGLCNYRIGTALGHGRVLYVDYFIALDIVGKETAARALMDAVNRLASAEHCETLHVAVPVSSSWTISLFRTLGHSCEFLHFCRPLTGTF